MPDRRQHRGPHPQDRQLFCSRNEPALRAATADLSWLLSKGYASNSALKLVGDRYCLTARQRLAVARCACGDEQRQRREQHRVEVADVAGHDLWIDGYNVITSLEAALAGGVILNARDGCYRDMASMHGSYRKVEETIPAIGMLGELIAQWNVASCCWYLDKPVSNSGRLKTLLGQLAEDHCWNWRVELVPDPDPVLIDADQIVASADSQILDKTHRWFNLARVVIESQIKDAWVLHLSG